MKSNRIWMVFFLLLFSTLICLSCSTGDGWKSLFDGQSLQGWTASENAETFQIEDGVIVVNGPRSHLFYTGEVEGADFQNFELALEVKTTPGSNSGIYIHTKFQQEGWPEEGYECQVLNSNRPGEQGIGERKMTGSLYAIRNVWKAPARDNEWFDYYILVQGKSIQVKINGELVADYTEPEQPFRPASMKKRLLGSGTFALQGHDPGSTVYYRNIRVKPLPDDLPSPGNPSENSSLAAQVVKLSSRNFPLMDLHVHLKQGLTIEQAMAKSRDYGITYGIAVNCGLMMPYPSEESLNNFLETYQKPPQSFLAMQAEGREWLDIFTKETIEKFDYVFTDAMTWTNDDGKRMRLWIADEVEIGDPQKFMEMLVDRIEKILDNEPIDIYVNPSYIPDEIGNRYDELWTNDRMDRVIAALVRNEIALEINDARRIPSAAFIKRAKSEGVKFTFGTNNAGQIDLGNLEYCLEMIQECGLEPGDIWIPESK